MTWEIIAGLIILIGFLISLGTVLARLVRTLQKLIDACVNLDKSVACNEERNAESHRRLFAALEKHDKELDDHELRIHDLERSDDK